jgi:L-threonylcarbamoyladenylate synthase
MTLVAGDGPARIAAKAASLAEGYGRRGWKVGVLATDETLASYAAAAERAGQAWDVRSMGSRGDPATIAASIYRLLRALDEGGARAIVCEGVDRDGIGAAVMNRLEKAAGGRIAEAGDGEGES